MGISSTIVSLASFLVAFVVTWGVGKQLIPLLQRYKAGQSIKTDGPTWHMGKQGTPTMGGIMFIVGIGLAVFLLGLESMKQGEYSHLFVFGLSLIFGIIGMIDDLQKLRRKANEGLSALQKLLLQLAVSFAFVVLLHQSGDITPNLYVPFFNVDIPLAWSVYLSFAAFVMVATVNAVNLTDGVDGLATGVTIPVMLFFLAVGIWSGHQAVSITAAAFVGGLSAFLLFNYHPAKVFMGDTGSLALGGALSVLAVLTKTEVLLIVLGLVYIVEALSVVIQVFSFKVFGRRVFKMSPIHHHFEMCGWSERKIVATFWTVAAICVILALFMVSL